MEANNMKAMREALIAIRDACFRWTSGHLSFASEVPIEKILDDALSAPPRNCDNAETWLDLYKHFHAPKGMREMPPEWVDAIAAFCQWLVATAKERKEDAE